MPAATARGALSRRRLRVRSALKSPQIRKFLPIILANQLTHCVKEGKLRLVKRISLLTLTLSAALFSIEASALLAAETKAKAVPKTEFARGSCLSEVEL